MYGSRLLKRIATVSSQMFQVQNHVKRVEEKRVNNTNDINITLHFLGHICVRQNITSVCRGGGKRWSWSMKRAQLYHSNKRSLDTLISSRLNWCQTTCCVMSLLRPTGAESRSHLTDCMFNTLRRIDIFPPGSQHSGFFGLGGRCERSGEISLVAKSPTHLEQKKGKKKKSLVY